ncbi:MAG: outer membrane protein-like peptidoglycan-associated protein [Acidobacteria bacterium]|nr:outer membrane protein-like peptidoglycan-associated protein [Acidobacteriota bacterium]
MKQLIFTSFLIVTFCVFSFAQSEKSACPTINVIGPSSITYVDEPAFFSVELSDEAKNYKIEYEWKVERAEIAGGQGTSQIMILPKMAGGNIKATVVIKGLPKNCSNTASELAGTARPIIIEPFEEYQKLPLEDELGRLDNFMSRLSEDKDYKGFIFIITDESESIETVKKHIQVMLKHFKFREFPKDRLTFAIEKSNHRKTLLWIIPDGGKFPSCENCKIIKANDL